MYVPGKLARIARGGAQIHYVGVFGLPSEEVHKRSVPVENAVYHDRRPYPAAGIACDHERIRL